MGRNCVSGICPHLGRTEFPPTHPSLARARRWKVDLYSTGERRRRRRGGEEKRNSGEGRRGKMQVWLVGGGLDVDATEGAFVSVTAAEDFAQSFYLHSHLSHAGRGAFAF